MDKHEVRCPACRKLLFTMPATASRPLGIEIKCPRCGLVSDL